MLIRELIRALLITTAISAVHAAEAPFLESELIFPLESWHNHGSCIVEAPNGDLIVCWFHGSGERTADDVKIEGARKRKGSSQWSKRFTMADTIGYPDTNCCMIIDPEERLWLFWPAILANLWESALMKYSVSSDYSDDGPPVWNRHEVLHITPGDVFTKETLQFTESIRKSIPATLPSGVTEDQALSYLDDIDRQATNKLTRRLGWMTRAHPFILNKERMIVPLYSDGYSFSLMALTDDWGATWRVSNPIVGLGNIQPSIVQRDDGALYTLMRDNGPPPKRLLHSHSDDNGETWTPAADSALPNPGAGAEIIELRNGHWLLISNDTENGRHQLAVQISDDEGKTWRWKRYLEKDADQTSGGQYHYPSVIQGRDGTLHATYSHHLHPSAAETSANGEALRKSIKHAHFNEAWVQEGQR